MTALSSRRSVKDLGISRREDTRKLLKKRARAGLSLGLTLIDTAEIYSDGRSEELIGRVIGGQRDRVFLVSKVPPNHATGDGLARACEGSLARLGTDYLDLRGPTSRGNCRFSVCALGHGLCRKFGAGLFRFVRMRRDYDRRRWFWRRAFSDNLARGWRRHRGGKLFRPPGLATFGVQSGTVYRVRQSFGFLESIWPLRGAFPPTVSPTVSVGFSALRPTASKERASCRLLSLPGSGNGGAIREGGDRRAAFRSSSIGADSKIAKLPELLSRPSISAPTVPSPAVKAHRHDVEQHRLPLLVFFRRQHGEGLAPFQSVDCAFHQRLLFC